MPRGKRGRSKKAVVESIQREEEEELGGGTLWLPEQAAVLKQVVEGAAPMEEVFLHMNKEIFHCFNCPVALKPPIFMCESGHSLCSACHDKLPKDKCSKCGLHGAYRRDTSRELVVAGSTNICRYTPYGCRTICTYPDSVDHELACPYTPCWCPVPNCTFREQPSSLCNHLADAPHSWPVSKISYGSANEFVLPASQRQRLLVAEDDGCGFILSTCALGSSHRGASVVCVRATTGPQQYTYWMCAMGRKSAATDLTGKVLVEGMEVPSLVLSAETEEEEAAAARLVVQKKDLHGAFMEMRLTLRIEKV